MHDSTIIAHHRPSVADVALEHAMLDVLDLEDRVRDLEADVITYRTLLCEALAVAHDLTTDRDRLRVRYHAALDENRRLRADLAASRPRRAA